MIRGEETRGVVQHPLPALGYRVTELPAHLGREVVRVDLPQLGQHGLHTGGAHVAGQRQYVGQPAVSGPEQGADSVGRGGQGGFDGAPPPPRHPVPHTSQHLVQYGEEGGAGGPGHLHVHLVQRPQ
ncbi:hypothetical protein ACWZEH_35125 (plasmid) [Streptomyces sp. QTS137]